MLTNGDPAQTMTDVDDAFLNVSPTIHGNAESETHGLSYRAKTSREQGLSRMLAREKPFARHMKMPKLKWMYNITIPL